MRLIDFVWLLLQAMGEGKTAGYYWNDDNGRFMYFYAKAIESYEEFQNKRRQSGCFAWMYVCMQVSMFRNQFGLDAQGT